MRKTLTILLAGGVGSRLNILVNLRAKPAVPFGGIYRIIDFTLSNIANSGLTRVAVLTQYKPLSLMDHIGDGSAWDLSGRTRSIKILPPKTGEKDWDWYKGTADAVRQNLDFITSDRDYSNVLILSGDHIYAMDYSALVEFHRSRSAKVTIGMIQVPKEETRNFGIGIIDGKHRIIDWEEKPKKARSTLASMGIYVFDKDYLVAMLKKTSKADFGHHIIPKAMQEGNVYAYHFKGYWKDVGTIQAYWDGMPIWTSWIHDLTSILRRGKPRQTLSLKVPLMIVRPFALPMKQGYSIQRFHRVVLSGAGFSIPRSLRA